MALGRAVLQCKAVQRGSQQAQRGMVRVQCTFVRVTDAVARRRRYMLLSPLVQNK
jgi:hypothetical protein